MTMLAGSPVTLKQIGNYRLTGKILGKGNFARVELAENKLTGSKVAIKIIDVKRIKEDYVRRNILREALIMKKLRHNNIIKLYETLKYDSLYFLVTELVEGGDLKSYLQQQKAKKLSETHGRNFFRQLVSALQHLHDNGVVHRDLKMENILLDASHKTVKIVDFGLSNIFSKHELLKTHCGSPEYAAPELFEKGCLYGPGVDIWSMGVVLYGIMVGHLPFRFTGKLIATKHCPHILRIPKIWNHVVMTDAKTYGSSTEGGPLRKEELFRHARKGLTLVHEKYLSKLSSGVIVVQDFETQTFCVICIQADLLRYFLLNEKAARFKIVSVTSYLIENEAENLKIGDVHLVQVPNFGIGYLEDIGSIETIDQVASIYSSSLDETENHLQKCQYDARGAVYQLLLDRAMADLKQRSSSRSSSFGSIKRRPGPSGSSQVYREQKPSEQLDEDKMRKTRSSHGKGNSGSKTAKDGKSKEVVKNDGDQGVGDKDNQEIMRERRSSSLSKFPFSNVKIVDWTDALKAEERETSSYSSRKSPSPVCTRGWSKSKRQLTKESCSGGPQREGNQMTKRNGLNSWDHETDSECTADCHSGQEEDNGHFFMLPSRNMSDVRPKTNVYSRVDAKKPPTLASGFRVRAFSANRRFVTSSIKKQAKSFHAPENERVVPVKSRSRSLDLGTTKQERSAYNEDLQSDADVNQAKTESKSDDTRHELCDSIRFGRSSSWSIDIIPDVKRIPVLESSKKPFGKLTRRSSVGVANRAKLGTKTVVNARRGSSAPTALDRKQQNKIRFGGRSNRRVVVAFQELERRNQNFIRGKITSPQPSKNHSQPHGKVIPIKDVTACGSGSSLHHAEESVIDNIKANEEIDSLAEMEKTLYLEDTPSQILTGANRRNCDSCNIDSTEHILGEITNEHISVDGKASHCGSENRTTPGFRRYVKYINKQRKHVSGILKNSSSCHVAGHEDQVIEDDGCSARSKKSTERKNLRVTFEDEL